MRHVACGMWHFILTRCLISLHIAMSLISLCVPDQSVCVYDMPTMIKQLM